MLHVVFPTTPSAAVSLAFRRAVCVAVCLAPCLSAPAAVLCYKAGGSPNSADLHTVIYTEKIGSLTVNGGSIVINGRSIIVYGRPDEVSERNVFLNGQIVKTIMSHDKTGTHLMVIAYFSDGILLQNHLRSRQNEIVFIEKGFVSGKIDSFTPDSILINDHGSPRSVQLSTVLAIRSPHIYNLQVGLVPSDAYGNNSYAASSTTENKSRDKLERQYNITWCSLKETVPPQTISPQSIAPRSAYNDYGLGDGGLGDDDFNDDNFDERF